MNSNEISNPKTEVSSGIALNDKDYITCLLTSLKEMVKNYAISLTEVSNEHLYKKYAVTFQKISKLQRDTYEVMFRNGWYKLKRADQTKITEKYNTLNQEYIDLSQ